MNLIRLMLIDDEPSVLAALQRLLRRRKVAGFDCHIETFTSPLQAIEAARDRPFDLVMSDYRMPELDGVETLRQIKELQPGAGRIMLSATRDFDTVINAINVAQVGRIVVKPWHDVELVAVMADTLETRRLQLENAELADQLRVQRGLLTQQDAELRRIETQWPGITRVKWDTDGSICITEANIGSTAWGKLQS